MVFLMQKAFLHYVIALTIWICGLIIMIREEVLIMMNRILSWKRQYGVSF